MKFVAILTALALVLLAPLAVSAQDSVTVTLSERNDSGISGTAELTQVGGDLEVVISVSGVEEGSDHPVHIHSGSCDDLGGIVHPLSNIVDGESTTMLSGVTLASVADGEHAVNAHRSPDDLAESVTCGSIEAMEMEPEGTEAATDEASPTTEATQMATATSASPEALPRTGGGGAAPNGPSTAMWLVIVAVAGAIAFGALLPARQRR